MLAMQKQGLDPVLRMAKEKAVSENYPEELWKTQSWYELKNKLNMFTVALNKMSLSMKQLTYNCW